MSASGGTHDGRAMPSLLDRKGLPSASTASIRGQGGWGADMAEYRIVCVQKAIFPHGHHITAVGTGSVPTYYDLVWTVGQVRSALAKPIPDKFYTLSADGRVRATVSAYDCTCGVQTLRSHADGIGSDNLDNLGPCT